MLNFKVTVLENYIKIEATIIYNSFFNASNDKRTHCSVFVGSTRKYRESLRNLNNKKKKCNFRVAVGEKKKKTSPKKQQQQQQQHKKKTNCGQITAACSLCFNNLSLFFIYFIFHSFPLTHLCISLILFSCKVLGKTQETFFNFLNWKENKT